MDLLSIGVAVYAIGINKISQDEFVEWKKGESKRKPEVVAAWGIGGKAGKQGKEGELWKESSVTCYQTQHWVSWRHEWKSDCFLTSWYITLWKMCSNLDFWLIHTGFFFYILYAVTEVLFIQYFSLGSRANPSLDEFSILRYLRYLQTNSFFIVLQKFYPRCNIYLKKSESSRKILMFIKDNAVLFSWN